MNAGCNSLSVAPHARRNLHSMDSVFASRGCALVHPAVHSLTDSFCTACCAGQTIILHSRSGCCAMTHPIVLQLIELMHGLQLQGVDAHSAEVVQLLQDASKGACTPSASQQNTLPVLGAG